MFLLECFLQLIMLEVISVIPLQIRVNLSERCRVISAAVRPFKHKTGGILILFLFSEWKHLLCTENMPANHLLLAGLGCRYLLFGV